MAEADDGLVVDQADGDDSDEEVAATTSAKKKKKRNKKKKSAAAAEAQPEEVVLEFAAAAPAVPAAEEAAAEAAAAEAVAPEATALEAGADEAEADEDEEAAAPTKKKKKKKSKKASADAVPEDALEEAPAEAATSTTAPPRQKEQVADGTDEEAEESGAENGTADPKKKRKKKKKKGAAAGCGSVPVACENGKGVPKYIPDEEYAQWVAEGLKATANGTEKVSKEELLKPPKAFWGYSYTGSLRPAFVTPQMRMPEFVAKPDYATHSEGASLSERTGPREVPILEGKDLQNMRDACRYGREVLDIAARYLSEGVTGDEIDRIVYQACVDRKIYPSPLNYYRFPKSVCVSPNEVICHGIPDCRPIQQGDIVNLDVSVYHNGFHADLNETYFIGECDEDAHRVVRTAYCALHAAAQLIRPGTLYRELGNVIHHEATKSNCAVVTTYCGHGVGQLFHGPPKIPHYRKNKAVGVMKPGHVFTVEPMINLGNNGSDRTWPDDWTAVTKDGKRSAQFEHTFLVTETGVELLTGRHGTDPFSMPVYDSAMFQR